ncbi:MAG: transcription elongation factor [Myxococcales bacterium]|nr:transcription elongation factor [Myxococcales bacterium]
MPNKKTIRKARQDERQGKAPTTQAGEFVHEEMDHIREGKHGARNTKQAIAIGLSKARRAGVKLPPPKKGRASEATRRKAAQDTAASTRTPRAPAPRRSRATKAALKREGSAAASPQALSRQAKSASRTRKRGGGNGRGGGGGGGAKRRSSKRAGAKRRAS